jgi:hypothetical protein
VRTLSAYYDLAVGPVSYDVIPFLIQAKMAQEDADCDALQVVIVPDKHGVAGMFRDKTALYDAAEMDWRLWHIVVPACRLAGATATVVQDWAQANAIDGVAVWPHDWNAQTLANAHHHAKPIIEAARKGRRIPKLRASEHARRCVAMWMPEGRVTATLRNTYEPDRNADHLLSVTVGNKDVMVVEDTVDALIRGSGYAELDLDLRMAVYERAHLNLHVNGGTAQLCWYSDAAFLQFDAGGPSEVWARHWEWLGLRQGDQLPWANPNQRLVYGRANNRDVVTMAKEFA